MYEPGMWWTRSASLSPRGQSSAVGSHCVVVCSFWRTVADTLFPSSACSSPSCCLRKLDTSSGNGRPTSSFTAGGEGKSTTR